jgi:hypothetical protein
VRKNFFSIRQHRSPKDCGKLNLFNHCGEQKIASHPYPERLQEAQHLAEGNCPLFNSIDLNFHRLEEITHASKKRHFAVLFKVMLESEQRLIATFKK